MDQLASISTRETIDAQLPPVRHHQFLFHLKTFMSHNLALLHS